jgi:hypothetical protein
MLDNIRDQASFQDDEEEADDLNELNPPKTRKPRQSFDQIIGMSAMQRFALAVILLVMVCLLGTMFLLLSGKMVPSFLF